jgi:DNA polymerase-3 subunit alpha
MDFLGLSNLTIIKNALRIIRKRYGIDIQILELPLDDAATYALLSRAETTGVFQLESDGMKRYLRELKPSEFEDIIAMCALYRPGPMEFIPDFIARKHGTKVTQYLHPAMEPVLKPTYGIMVYQEQMMQLSRILAGFTPGEADTLRKGVGKKIKAVLDKVEPQFYAGCARVGYLTEGQAKRLWQEWLAWAKYGFNKSHAACYALIAYQTAYLKAHYPAAFMAALLTSDFSNLDRLAIELAECERIGITVLPPSVNESYVEFGVVTGQKPPGSVQDSDDTEPTADRRPPTEAIRFGLSAIKNVGTHVAERMVAERTPHGSYQSLQDFLKRLGPDVVNRKVIETLAKAGALDEFADRAELLGNLDQIVKFSQLIAKEAASGQIDLFGSSDFAADTAIQLELGPADPISKVDRLAWEKELLGAYLSDHPLNEYRAAVEAIGSPIRDLTHARADQRTTIAGVIQSLESKVTKKGDAMAFGQFEDFTGRIELLIFSRALQEQPDLWVPGRVLEVRGKIRAKDGSPKLVVDSAKPLAKIVGRPRSIGLTHSKTATSSDRTLRVEAVTVPVIDPATPTLELALPAPLTHELLAELKQLLAAHPGDTTITFVVGHNGSTVRQPAKSTVRISPTFLESLVRLLGTQAVSVPSPRDERARLVYN